MQERIDSVLRCHLVPATEYIFGYSDLTGLLDKEFGVFRYAISIGRMLDSLIVESIAEGPTVEYYTHYRGMNADLAALSHSIAEDLNELGIETRLVEPSVTAGQLDMVYEKTLRTPVSHKMVATRAGLGWIGKSDLFISRKFGPRLRLVSILTNTPLRAITRPINKSRCGTCNLCVVACPVGAANGKRWDITVDRDEFFDAFKCRWQCAEFGRTRLSMDARVCGICMAACPIGK